MSQQVDDAGGPGEGLLRDRLANERTFLAWLRTAANVMIVGLAVARFGAGGEVTAGSLAAGSELVVVGVIGVGFAGARFRTVDRELSNGTHATTPGTFGPLVASIVLVVAVIAAVVLLLLDGG